MKTLKDASLDLPLMRAGENLKQGQMIRWLIGRRDVIIRARAGDTPLGVIARKILANQLVYPEDVITEIGL